MTMEQVASATMEAPDDPGFYEAHWQQTRTSSDPHVIEKAGMIAALVPDGVREVLDVGCGDGTITAVLARAWQVTAVDRSAQALAHVAGHSPQVRCVQASADRLPFDDGAFDLTMTSEMLEHLAAPALAPAAAEIARVTRRWLLVSVPHNENIRKRFVQCPACGLEFHLYGHLHRLDRARLEALFGDFEVRHAIESGPTELPTSPGIEAFRQRRGRRWHLWAGAKARCPGCSNQQFPLPNWSLQHRIADWCSDWATSVWRTATQASPHPFWITLLMERRQGAA